MIKGNANRFLFSKIHEYANGKKTLDIGCGNKAYSGVSNDVTTLDGWDKVNPDILLNLENSDLPFSENEFECVLMIDFIEHLTRKRGEEVLRQAKKITSGRIYLLTPLWWDSNHKHTNDPKCWAYGNELNLHLSQWETSDFDGWHDFGKKNYFFGYWEKPGSSE